MVFGIAETWILLEKGFGFGLVLDLNDLDSTA